MDEEFYSQGDVADYVEPRRPRGPSDEELAKARKAQMWRTVAIVAAVAAALLLLATSTYTSYAIRQQQKVNTPLTNSTKQTADRIKDCTTPGEDCYEQAQRQAGEAVAGVNTVTIRVAACAKAIPDTSVLSVAQVAAQIKACVRADHTTVKAERLPQATLSSSALAPKVTNHARPQHHEPAPGKHHTPTPGPSPVPSPSPTCLPLPYVSPMLCIPPLG